MQIRSTPLNVAHTLRPAIPVSEPWTVLPIEISIVQEFFYHFVCTGLVQLVGNTWRKVSNKMMRGLFKATLRTEWKPRDKFKFPVNQMNCFILPIKCYDGPNISFADKITKPNETRILRIFLEHLGMQSHLQPNNWHIHLIFLSV